MKPRIRNYCKLPARRLGDIRCDRSSDTRNHGIRGVEAGDTCGRSRKGTEETGVLHDDGVW